VNLFWFLLGLATGLISFAWYPVQLNRKLKKLIRNLKPDGVDWSQSSTTKLARAIALQTEQQEQLEQELAIWTQICQLAPIGLMRVDEDNQLIAVNPCACELLNIQMYSLPKPRLLLELVRSYDLDQLIEQTRDTHQPGHRDWTLYPSSPDPSQLSKQQPRSLRSYAFPLPNRCVGVFLQDRQEVVSLGQQRDRWISDVAHELKTPLTSIRLVAETLQLRLHPPQRDWITRLIHETIRLSSLVQDLLDLSHLEARSVLQLNRQSVDLPSLIQSAWSGLEPLARRKQVQMNYHGPAHLLIQADEPRLHRVLLNLLDNSLKYSPARQCIWVNVSLNVADREDCSEQTVHLEVIDAGPGFPEDAIPYVFERFYRADPSRTRRITETNIGSPQSVFHVNGAGAIAADNLDDEPLEQEDAVVVPSGGSGLGLAIVRQIVEAHQGIVTAGNHPDTQGAWVQIFLPYQK
jgi:two-component system phosphate regulon sensor histidine kinase PhoR